MSNRRVLVTGGNRGIGFAVAKAFAEAGDRVAITFATREEQAKEAAKALESAGAKEVLCLKMDIGSEADIQKGAEDLLKRWEGLDILINNAGMNKDNLLARLKTEEWDRILDVNLRGSMLLCREFSRAMMKARNGVMINMTSVAGQMGNQGQAAYSASKAGLIGLTKSLARELASRNIRVNAVAPGFIETEMVEAMDSRAKEGIIELVPLKRLGKAEEVAALCLFLADEKASYLTGQIIGINGGLYI